MHRPIPESTTGLGKRAGDIHGIDYLRPAPPSYCEQHGSLGRRLSRRMDVNISHISLLPLSQRRLHPTVL